MNHHEAVQQMAAERYLLDELADGARDEFEEHMFDCSECALDVRAGATFVSETKVQLPQMIAGAAAPHVAGKQKEKRSMRFSWWRPAFAAPVFATLLIVMGYQNLFLFPALHRSAEQPRIVALAPLYGATRGGGAIGITADRAHGVGLPVDLPLEPGLGNFASYAFDLTGPQGKTIWTGTIAAPAQQPGGDLQLSVVVPGGMLQKGAYSVSVFGVGAQGERTSIGRSTFDVTLTK